jgi:hypothetical protein
MSLTKRSLGPAQLKLVEAIEELGFGRIDQIPVCDGSPCLERATQTVREINLGSEPKPFERCLADLTLKAEFERLLNELSQLGDGLVDVEIRHGAPFKLLVRRRGKELVG